MSINPEQIANSTAVDKITNYEDKYKKSKPTEIRVPTQKQIFEMASLDFKQRTFLKTNLYK